MSVNLSFIMTSCLWLDNLMVRSLLLIINNSSQLISGVLSVQDYCIWCFVWRDFLFSAGVVVPTVFTLNILFVRYLINISSHLLIKFKKQCCTHRAWNDCPVLHKHCVCALSEHNICESASMWSGTPEKINHEKQHWSTQ